jgi:hypothetical protein
MAGRKSAALAAVNRVLDRAGVQLVRPSTTFQDYIALETTLAGAKAAGLSVGDYIDRTFNVPGSTQETIDRMAQLGVFQRSTQTVCEIGPGSGRYLEKVLQQCQPERYEIYETAEPWRDWLVERYPVVALPVDGSHLSGTADRSVDLVHSHKVLNGLPVITACSYFFEMSRVAAEHSTLVFDVLTEDCLDDDTLRGWMSSGTPYVTSMIGRQFTLDFFARRGFACVGEFDIASRPGRTHYFVFTR